MGSNAWRLAFIIHSTRPSVFPSFCSSARACSSAWYRNASFSSTVKITFLRGHVDIVYLRGAVFFGLVYVY